MRRWIRIAGVLVPLLVGTVVVLWAGLGGAPPGWILEYGIPATEPGGGRVANVSGTWFVEVPRGCHPVSRVVPFDAIPGLLDRFLPQGRPEPLYVSGTSSGLQVIEIPLTRSWVEVPRPVWVEWFRESGLRTQPLPGWLALRPAVWYELQLADRWAPWPAPATRPWIRPSSSLRAFSLPPGKEALAEPYLVHDLARGRIRSVGD